jgi:hypothetical protein
MRPTVGYRNTTPAVNIGDFQPWSTAVYRVSMPQIHGASAELADEALRELFLLNHKREN